jgi:hypothetical protein
MAKSASVTSARVTGPRRGHVALPCASVVEEEIPSCSWR